MRRDAREYISIHTTILFRTLTPFVFSPYFTTNATLENGKHEFSNVANIPNDFGFCLGGLDLVPGVFFEKEVWTLLAAALILIRWRFKYDS